MQFASMFHEHLRQRSQMVEVCEGVVGALAREAPNAAGVSQGTCRRRVGRWALEEAGGLGLCKRLLSR